MDCQKCSKSDAVRSVGYILLDGTIETNSQTEVEGFADTTFKATIDAAETFRGERTGLSYSGTIDGDASTSTYEFHETRSLTQTRLASMLSNAFGPYLEDPEILLTPEAIAEKEAEDAKKSNYFWVAIGIFVGAFVLELMATGVIIWSVLLAAPVALLIAGFGWFMGLGTEVAALEKSASSPINQERFSAVAEFNNELAELYGWLETTAYCSRCNVISDEEEFFEVPDLRAARPEEPDFQIE